MNVSLSSLISWCLRASAATASLLFTGEASAGEMFRYVDRSGQVHLVPVHSGTFAASPASRAAEAPPAAAPPAPPPALPAAAEPAPLSAVPAVPAAPAAPAPVPLFAPAAATLDAERVAVVPVAPLPAAPLVPLDPASVPHYGLIREAAEFYSLPVALMLALIQVESRFNPRAVSRKGALGLAQLMPATAEELGVTDPFDPKQNVFAGARLLRSLINEFDGRVALALAAYNAGAGAVRRHGGVPPSAETQAYVPAVMGLYRAYLSAGQPQQAPGRSPSW